MDIAVWNVPYKYSQVAEVLIVGMPHRHPSCECTNTRQISQSKRPELAYASALDRSHTERYIRRPRLARDTRRQLPYSHYAAWSQRQSPLRHRSQIDRPGARRRPALPLLGGHFLSE